MNFDKLTDFAITIVLAAALAGNNVFILGAKLKNDHNQQSLDNSSHSGSNIQVTEDK